MSNKELELWLRSREPEIPTAFLPHLLGCQQDQPEGGDGNVTASLSLLGVEALSSALDRPGRDRGAAFHLLVADAFITYACESAAEAGGDTVDRLSHLLMAVGARFN